MDLKKFFRRHTPAPVSFELLKYIGPGFIVTVGFIDPGNWATNLAAGSAYGYSLLWVVTLSTVMLILLQHNAAHLGIVTGLCLSEASTKFFGKVTSRTFLFSAVLASIATALAEILGAAIGLNMLTGLPIVPGAILSTLLVSYLLLSNSYRRIEKWIIGFVSLIGLSFVFEMSLIETVWKTAFAGWVVPSIPYGSIAIIMGVLGAVVMPHNLFLHSEVIQSRQLNLQGEEVIQKQLRYEFMDTLFAMSAGWAINSAMILVAASVFFARGIGVTELQQAQATLKPLLGNAASGVFALALLFAGVSSSVTAGMAGGSIFAGIFQEPYNIKDSHSRTGVLITLFGGLAALFFLGDPFQAIIWSQIALSIQLPWTIVSLIALTSSSKVMGRYRNAMQDRVLLWSVAAIVILLNILLLIQIAGF